LDDGVEEVFDECIGGFLTTLVFAGAALTNGISLAQGQGSVFPDRLVFAQIGEIYAHYQRQPVVLNFVVDIIAMDVFIEAKDHTFEQAVRVLRDRFEPAIVSELQIEPGEDIFSDFKARTSVFKCCYSNFF
jgi:hypothetical protein